MVHTDLPLLPDICIVERGGGAMHDRGDDELLDLVADQDQAIGLAWRSVIYRAGRAKHS